MSIEVWPNGFVKYQESFNAKIESPMDLRLMPFDEQSLEIYFHPFNYSRSEVLLLPCEGLSRIWSEDRGIAQWVRLDNEIKEESREIHYFDGTKSIVSELTFIVNVKRKPLNMLVSIIFPLIILVCLTWCVFWMDEEPAANRVNITFIGILSVVAYYLVIQDKIPEISYITIIDMFILLTFTILAATVIISIVVDKLNKSNKKTIGDKLDHICRWLFPTIYFSGTAIIVLLFMIFE